MDRFAPESPAKSRSAIAEPGFTREILTVGQLNRAIAGLLERSLPLVWVGGELSNLTRAASGHWYFSLKDASAQVRAVMFRGRAQSLAFTPREGDRVEVRALASLYEPRGDFQLNVEVMRRAGAGDLHQRFLELKAKLQAEGLFEAERKRTPARLPNRIGVITSPQAAALRDVLTTLRRRAPQIPVVLYPAPVQGVDAPAGLRQALAKAVSRAECEVLLLVRGGGSIEDLWAFNDEALARAIADCPVPVISGVGHETDFTLVDFVSDVRAPTPTAAAEFAAADREELLTSVRALASRTSGALSNAADRAEQRLDLAVARLRPPSVQWRERAHRLALCEGRLGVALRALMSARLARLAQQEAKLRPPRLNTSSLRLQSVCARLTQSARTLSQEREARVRELGGALELVSPLAVLARGYAIVADTSGRVLRDGSGIIPGSALHIRLHEDELDASVLAIRKQGGAVGAEGGAAASPSAAAKFPEHALPSAPAKFPSPAAPAARDPRSPGTTADSG